MKLWFSLGVEESDLLSLGAPDDQRSLRRIPIIHPTPDLADQLVLDNFGTLIPGTGKPSEHPGGWPQFRGPNRDNIIKTERGLATSWPADGPRELWRIPVGEGYAGAAIHEGRVYIIDYDREKWEDAIRCLSLDTGEEIWRYTYSVEIRRSHGMSRTVPTIHDRFLITLGPKCHVHCLDVTTGERIWMKDLVREHNTIVPEWYAGQCPLVDEGRLILAPGADPLMMAFDLETSATLWTAESPDITGMTHSSILAFDFQGKRQYIYCAVNGVAGVDAGNGALLWTHPEWKVKGACVASPVPVGEDLIFFTGGYGAGSMMLRLVADGDAIKTEEVFRIEERIFGSEQHTPILYKDLLYGVDKLMGKMVCLDLEGNRVWSSGNEFRFEKGPYMFCDDHLLVLDGKKGILHLARVTPSGFKPLAQAQILHGHDAWGPMAVAEGRLVLRDFEEMVCVDIGK